MPDKPRTRRSGAGPGRGKPRPRAGSRASRPRTAAQPLTDPTVVAPEADRGERRSPRQARRLGLTRRAVALFVVLAVLVLSYASSLRIYLDTERQNAENRQAIERSQARIDELNGQLQRWDDPDYVRAQARERLGWVVPGETGYRVIGPDGRPVGTRIESQPRDPKRPPEATWWQKMWGSVQAADRPAPPPTPPSARPPITDGNRTPTPSASPTAKRTTR